MCLLLLGIIAVVGFFWYRRTKKAANDEIALHKTGWQKGTVYLMQVPVSPYVRSLSPFALKLETWLRANKIPYETLFTLRRSTKSQTPFIEYKQYPDSNLIIQFLKGEFGLDPRDELDDVSWATGHSLQVMMENHTTIIGFYWRYAYHTTEIVDRFMNLEISELYKLFAKFLAPLVIRIRGYIQGISRHSNAEMDQFSFDDLEAISKILGKKKFLFGDKPTTIDCTLFGHLAQFIYLPLAFPQKEFINKECPNLAEFVDRMRDTFWPDWKEMCNPKCMEGKKSKLYM